MVRRRYTWAQYMQSLAHSRQWYYTHLLWTDICNSILPNTEKKAAEQALARKGSRTWGSADTIHLDAELRGDKRALKTNSWDTRRVWWAPMLTRGKLHVEVLPPDFAGDRPDGAEVFVERLRVGLNRRFPNAEGPRVVFVDRGAGFYNPGDGQITWQFKAALQRHGLRAFMRDDASVQPGHLADLMLHETAVAWIRRQERQHFLHGPGKKPETRSPPASGALWPTSTGRTMWNSCAGTCRRVWPPCVATAVAS